MDFEGLVCCVGGWAVGWEGAEVWCAALFLLEAFGLDGRCGCSGRLSLLLNLRWGILPIAACLAQKGSDVDYYCLLKGIRLRFWG
jgi:hypothetical protein